MTTAIYIIIYMISLPISFKLILFAVDVKSLDELNNQDRFIQCLYGLLACVTSMILIPMAVFVGPALLVGWLMKRFLAPLMFKKLKPPELEPHITYGESISYRHPPIKIENV